MECKNCGKETGQIKAGKMRAGSQKYKCKHCGKVYTPNPKERSWRITLPQFLLLYHMFFSWALPQFFGECPRRGVK